MSPKLLAKYSVVKRKKDTVTVDLKKEIIEKHERGVCVTDLAREYGRSSSTICTILKRKKEFKKLKVAKGVTKVTKKHPKILEEIEKLLLVWMNERKRSSKHSVVQHGEAANSDKAAAEKFVPEFQEFVAREEFLPQQVFQCDESGMFRKKMMKRTYIMQEEQSLPGYTTDSGRLTGVVKKYLEEKPLPLKALLVLDNSSAHPPQMHDDLFPENQFFTIKFLPPNTTPPSYGPESHCQL
ncbi:tigger transposable element-derived protein 1-like [Procambarus clarkii]|uniref:tigger transposable element-derived protein 1-like n=1 Tax=Procambarus clarkii TaxID=6728 RepID=UPI00374236F2